MAETIKWKISTKNRKIKAVKIKKGRTKIFFFKKS